MLTKKDIEKIVAVVATKADITRLEEKTDAIQETVQGLVTGVDKLSKKVDDLHHEYIALKLSDDRQNKQIHQIAKKIDIKLEV